MNLYFILMLTCLLGFTACNSQNIQNTYNVNALIPTPKIGKTVPHLSNHLWYIFQDSKNRYWFGSDGEGVFCFDGKTIINYSTSDGLSSNRIRQILEDSAGNMFFSTLAEIHKFDGKTMSTLHPIKSTDWKLKKNDLWFNKLGKANEDGVYRYDGKNLYNLKFPKHYLEDAITKPGIHSFFSPYDVYCIYKDRQGAIWFGTSVLGACRFDGKTVKWMYERDLTIVPEGGTFGIRSIFEDKNGFYWICNTSQKFVFDFEKTLKSDRLQYSKVPGIGKAEDFGGEASIYFSYILEDQEGNIWLTTWAQGVFKYDGKKITNYIIKENNKMVNLISMYKDKNANLWLGTPNNGVYKFNGHSFERFNPEF